MSYAAQGPQAALPVVSAAVEPASVRHGSASVKRAYQQGLGFEAMLVEELTRSLATGAGIGGEGGEAGEAPDAAGEASGAEAPTMGTGTDPLVSSLVPQTLAHSIIASGGLGLAAQFAEEVGARESTAGAAAAHGGAATGSSSAGASAPSSGGASASSSGLA
jgi:hypothetical protein